MEGKLWETLLKLAVTEANVHLFSTLKSLGLATNDVKHFVEKQALHKKMNKSLDVRIVKQCMHSKLVDACAYAKKLRQSKNSQRARVLKKYRNSKAKGKRVLKELLDRYREVKLSKMAESNKKIKFYKEKNELKKSIKQAPVETHEILSGVNLFMDNTNIVPEQPMDPFICDKSIRLSKNELLLLSRGPKYMIRGDLSADEFKIEVEKMVCKKKLDNAFRDKEDDLHVEPASRLPTARHSRTHTAGQSSADSQVCESNNSNSEFNVKWEEASGKMAYNELTKVLDLANMQCTLYTLQA